MTMPLTIVLPWAPSTNSYYRHVEIPLGKGKPACPVCGRRHCRVATLLSDAGRNYLRDVDRQLFMDVPEGVIFRGDLELSIVLFPPDRRSIDADNRFKAVLDSLKRRPKDDKQTAWLMEDDSQVKKLSAVIGPVSKGGKCVVTIAEIPSMEPGLFEKENTP